jgi:hypothetical protein
VYVVLGPEAARALVGIVRTQPVLPEPGVEEVADVRQLLRARDIDAELPRKELPDARVRRGVTSVRPAS